MLTAKNTVVQKYYQKKYAVLLAFSGKVAINMLWGLIALRIQFLGVYAVQYLAQLLPANFAY